MKRIIALATAIVLSVIMAVAVNDPKDIVRIHIRANSDSEADQQVKIQVRDEINEYLSPKLTNVKTKKQAEEIISGAIPEIKEIAENVSGENVNVTLSEEQFPEKTYNDKVYPAGEYTALIVSIGEGEGHNWWCVAFPPMCYTSSKSGKTEYRSLIYDFLERIGIL